MTPKEHIAFASSEDIPLSTRWLTRQEQAIIGSLPPGKKNDSILARIALKRAARDFFLHERGKPLPFRAYSAMNDFRGAPILSVNGVPCEDVSVSLSHGGGMAAAAVIPRSRGTVGIDIERIRNFDRDTVLMFLDEPSVSAYESAPKTEQGRFATVQWSLRESFLKAIGVGLREHPKSLSIGRSSPSYRLEYPGRATGTGREIPIFGTLRKDTVATIVVVPPGTAGPIQGPSE